MTPAGGGIREVGYTEDGVVWATMTLQINGQEFHGILQMPPALASETAAVLKKSAEQAQKILDARTQ